MAGVRTNRKVVLIQRPHGMPLDSDFEVVVPFGPNRSIKVYAMFSDVEGDVEFVLTVDEGEIQTLAMRCFSAAVVSYVTRFDEECIFSVGDLPEELGGSVR